MAGEKNMTIDQVAQRFGVSTRTIKNWWLSGRTCLEVFCPHHLIGRTGLKFTRKSVDEFAAKSRVKPDEYCNGGG